MRLSLTLKFGQVNQDRFCLTTLPPTAHLSAPTTLSLPPAASLKPDALAGASSGGAVTGRSKAPRGSALTKTLARPPTVAATTITAGAVSGATEGGHGATLAVGNVVAPTMQTAAAAVVALPLVFGIFDGHGLLGDTAAQVAATELPTRLASTLGPGDTSHVPQVSVFVQCICIYIYI
jgi:hypothetical protein